jgi:hypothetical protein
MLNNLIYAASSLAVDCGSGGSTSTFDHMDYQPDNANIGAASYYVTRIGAQTWGLSNVGNFMGAPNNYIIYNTSQFNNTQDSKLFQTARMSPSSLRYYGVGLENGNYIITLQFAEFDFEDTPTWKSLGRRVFDIYLQAGSTHAHHLHLLILTYELAMIFSLGTDVG